MTFENICRLLTREPYSFSFDDIAQLTDYQLINVLSEPKMKPTPPELRQKSQGFKEDFVVMTMAEYQIGRVEAEEFFRQSFPDYKERGIDG